MQIRAMTREGLTGGNKDASKTVTESEQGKPPFPIIVHSHLGWDWVWQRPQQFHSRLSEKHPILFVEGPRPLRGALLMPA